jgi:cation diffusion facilitator family transporter
MNSNRLFESKITADNVVLTSVFVDVLDILLNSVAALLTGSVVMIAETLQGVADLFSASFVYVGLKRSRRPATAKHLLGFGRELYIWALFSSLIMFALLASLSIYFGWQRLMTPQGIDNISVAYIVLCVSFISNGYSFSLSFRRIKQPGKNFFSSLKDSMFLESKTTLILDLLGTLAAFFGFLALVSFQITSEKFFDGLGAVIIGVLMALFSYFLIKNIYGLLIGQSAPLYIKNKIIAIVLKVDGVKKVLNTKALIIGYDRLIVNIEVNFKDGLTTDEIEKIIDQIKSEIAKNVPVVFHIQIEPESV